jgi:hypothetical protein
MPSDTLGFTGTELVSFMQSYTGNSSSDFQSFATLLLPLAEQRFCKAHDWSFLNKRNLSLTVASGTYEYDLSVATVGYYMPAADVRTVFCPASGIYLKKCDLEDIRRMDPDVNDGNTSAHLTHWAPVGDNTIMVYPPIFADTTLKIDGKISPSALSTLSNYPTIPYRYQDAFIEYLLSLCLDRENDDRANGKKQVFAGLLKQDIASDVGSISDAQDPRVRSLLEQRRDGVSANLDSLYAAWAWNSVD